MSRGAFRLWLALSLMWLCVSIWLYSTGADRDWNAHGIDGFVTERMSAEDIARLPRLDVIKERYANEENNIFLDWEGHWMYVTRGIFPSLYGRALTRDACRHILIRNYSDAPLYYRTTCRTQASAIGYIPLALLPMAVVGFLIGLMTWVANGFRASSGRS